MGPYPLSDAQGAWRVVYTCRSIFYGKYNATGQALPAGSRHDEKFRPADLKSRDRRYPVLAGAG